MKSFTQHTGSVAAMDRSNVDTDQIIPSDWLKQVERTGFEKGLFSEWRDEREFVLNDDRYFGSNILLSGPNFGTGSSREHAVWAIQQYGFAAVISPRFGPIFKNNSTKNGLVPVEVTAEVGQQLMAAVQEDPKLEITIDVARATVEAPAIDLVAEFDLSPSLRERFIKGLDDIGLTLAQAGQISNFEATRPAYMAS